MCFIHGSPWPLRFHSRPESHQCPLLLPLVSLSVCGGHRKRTKKPGQPPHPASCNKPIVKLTLKLGFFESHSNITKLYRGFPCVELRYNFPFLMPVSNWYLAGWSQFSRVLPASNSGACPRNSAWLGAAVYSCVGSVTSQATLQQY